jgi:hypothetical protein
MRFRLCLSHRQRDGTATDHKHRQSGGISRIPVLLRTDQSRSSLSQGERLPSIVGAVCRALKAGRGVPVEGFCRFGLGLDRVEASLGAESTMPATYHGLKVKASPT